MRGVRLVVALFVVAAPALADPAAEAFRDGRFRDAANDAAIDTPGGRVLAAAAWIEEARVARHAASALARVQIEAFERMVATGETMDLFPNVPRALDESRAYEAARWSEVATPPALPEVDWLEPVMWDGPPDAAKIALHDPWRIAEYAKACAHRAAEMLPTADGLAGGLLRYRDLVAGRIAMIDERYADAEAAFASVDDPSGVGAALERVAAAYRGELPTVLDWAALSPRAAEEAVTLLSLNPSVDWTPIATALDGAYATFERDVLDGRREAGRRDVERLQFATGIACGLSGVCDEPRTTTHLFDGRRAPGPDVNPATRVSGIVRTNLTNLNEQTTMLAMVHGVAETLPVFTGVYDALQLFYRYSLHARVEAPIGE